MEFLGTGFLSSLLAIILIDLVLAGDNAILIGLAARNLPKNKQKKAIIWGTLGAIFIRTVATFAVLWLLKIPGLLFVGGIILVYIAYKLLVDKSDHTIQSENNFWGAIRTIIIADALMGLDNVLAIAGAAQGHFLLVILGLMISIPIVMWGSSMILKWIERYPVIIKIGAAVLAWTAAKMIIGEPFMKELFDSNWLKYIFEIFVVIGVLWFGKLKNNKILKDDHRIHAKRKQVQHKFL